MSSARHPLTIIGDIGVDLLLGPLSSWPRIGTEIIMERSELRAGGSAGNVALAVSYLGGIPHLISAAGNDDFGSWLVGQFAGLAASLPVCDAPTTLSVGLIHASGERTIFSTRGHLDKLTPELVLPQLKPALLPNSIVHLTGVFLTPALRASYSQLIREVAALGYCVALDTNWPPGGWDAEVRAEAAAWIAACDHVLLNELEVANLADTHDLNVAIDLLTAMLKPGATLVVKVGARGAIGVQDGRRYDCEAPPATIFDTIGAGDSFNAGYLLARLNNSDLPAALAAGCKAAAAIISRFPRRLIRPGEFADQLAPRLLQAGARA